MRDKEWIGGYDLINEPKWNLGSNNAPLRELYINITNAIREVDTNHIVFIEGNWFATDFNGLIPAWDENLVYSFHKYWNENTQSSISNYLAVREQSG
ncbi:MAG: cellulase family glycosylhydrolase [Melioribacteraceae bacterium]|nr:cellulase family glycosylhydrolase [Melioribacteraceae bacterium]